MLNREPHSESSNSAYTINLRHYAISSKVTGLPKPIRRLTAAEKVKSNDRRGKGVPNLGQLGDVAEYLLDPTAGNYTSGSESEPETDAEVEVLTTATKKIYHKSKQEKRRAANGEIDGPGANEGKRGVEKHAIKLSELGPRMKLRLVKIEAGLSEGEIMWHEYIKKTKEEERNLKQIWEQRKNEKAERKRIQKENVAKKRKEKTARGSKGGQNEDEDEEMADYEDWDSEDIDEVQGM
jgi:ribosome biogenesis protein SSF1/2